MSANTFDLKEEWKKGRLPIISGILYENGDISWLNIESQNRKRRIEKGSTLHIKQLIQENKLFFSGITVLSTTSNEDKSIVISCGEGGYGSEGFIIVECNNKSIKWVAFFEESNPFEKIQIVGDVIYAYNNLHEKWIIHINNPTDLIIENERD